MRRAARALVSLLGLAAVVAGLPALLVAVVGWPLPHGLPGPGEVRSALGDGWQPGERFVLGVLAVLAWVLWAQLLRHVVAEVRIQRRRHHHSPADVLVVADPAPGGVSRRAAGWLVGGIMLAGPVPAMAATAAPNIPVVLTATNTLARPADSPPPSPPPTAATVASPSYVVHTWEESRDCLWTIAERHLGDPLRWGELVELNADLVQPDGTRLADDPRHWVYPGMQLRLPADAALAKVVNGAVPAQAFASNSTTPGRAERSPAPTASEPTTWPAVPVGAGDTRPAASPVRPGPVPAPASTNGSSPATTTTVATGAARRPSVSPAPDLMDGAVAEVAEPAVSSSPRPTARKGWEFPAVKLNGLGLAGAGLLAAGVAGALDRLIRVRSRTGRPRRVDPALAGAELGIRSAADIDGMYFLDVAMRGLVGSLHREKRTPADVLAVELGSRHLEVILAESCLPAPAGFSAKDGGRRWVARRDQRSELEELGFEMFWASPALVSVGRTADGGLLLIDLERAGVTAIVGDPTLAREVLVAAAVELVSRDPADFVRVVLVGLPMAEAMAGYLRVVDSVDSVDEVIDDLEKEADVIGQNVAGLGCASTLEARVRRQAFDCGPTTVLCASPLSPDQARRLTEAATKAGNAGVCVLALGPLPGAWELVVDDAEHLRVSMLDDLEVTPQHLAPGDFADLDAVVSQAELSRDEPGEEEPYFPDYLSVGGEDYDDDDDGGDTEPPQPGDDEARRTLPAAPATVALGPPPGLPAELAGLGLLADVDMLVGVLGPVELWGAAEPIVRSKSLEAVVYLAVNHRSPIDNERLADALWPGWELKPCPAGQRHPALLTLNTTISVARRCLGAGRAGQMRLPCLKDNHTLLYRLDGVSPDWQLLLHAMEHSRRAEDGGDRPAAKLHLREGLTLVRGRPFENVRDKDDVYLWALVTGAIAAMERDVCDAAQRLAKLCLADGDGAGARWAARQGLLAVPGHRALSCDEMRAAALDQDPAGVEAVIRGLEHLVRIEEPMDEVDAQVVAVYREQMAIALR